ncbi:hypothetical protein BCR44DRAFT_1447576 [Catenaria anguillulae PL171]|uniref:Uncharacterized protein n=1 Tax=Catenaria anguillulae PL171 TaxID=765915 RepID=A0A1Y2H810_9FUNG|nr:hypothetical protein BCR44DRAFT_1447576 [Catenaria anguillulae PL171]
MSASSAPREHGWDMSKQDLLALPHEDGPHGKIAPETSDPLALTWADLGELGSHDLISLAATHRFR